ncbi:MAG: 50S ribosomal protein L29 [Clostridia bacterium]|nr:50S ribosomal protein L29 [Clostridia bacterium]
MKAKNFFEMTNEELVNKINELKANLFNLRFKNAINQLSNPKEIEVCKRDIARAMTILRQRELGISEEPVKATKKKATKKTAKAE